MKKILSIAFLFTLMHVEAKTPEIFDEITESIKTGDVRNLSTYFNSTIDLTVGNQENTYSKAQAELILKDFFSKNPPKSFNILHNGSSPEGTHYVIGHLISVSGKTF